MNKCFFGDCREVMRDLVGGGTKVQTCVTSPPYWNLRDYGVEGQLGLEETPEQYIDNLVEVFDLVRELLADDGTLWLNLGDTYAHSGCGSASEHTSTLQGGLTTQNASKTVVSRRRDRESMPRQRTATGYKKKDLMGMPWRVAFALQAAGWYLRRDIIWHKPNPMPESCKDRPTTAHEYIFLMSKNPNYYYDNDSIREPCVQDEMANGFRGGAYCNNETFNNSQGGKRKNRGNYKTPDGWDTSKSEGGHGSFHRAGREKGHVGYQHKPRAGISAPGYIGRTDGLSRPPMVMRDREYHPNGKNKRSVWTVATHPYPDAHFATFPPDLIKPCIIAGSRAGDIVLDPFLGSGTTAQVAQELGRQWIGIELNPKYSTLQQARTAQLCMPL